MPGLGELRLEEVVAPAVEVEHRARGAQGLFRRRDVPDDRDDDVALVVGLQLDGALLEPCPEDVGRPGRRRHGVSTTLPKCSPAARRARPSRARAGEHLVDDGAHLAPREEPQERGEVVARAHGHALHADLVEEHARELGGRRVAARRARHDDGAARPHGPQRVAPRGLPDRLDDDVDGCGQPGAGLERRGRAEAGRSGALRRGTGRHPGLEAGGGAERDGRRRDAAAAPCTSTRSPGAAPPAVNSMR